MNGFGEMLVLSSPDIHRIRVTSIITPALGTRFGHPHPQIRKVARTTVTLSIRWRVGINIASFPSAVMSQASLELLVATNRQVGSATVPLSPMQQQTFLNHPRSTDPGIFFPFHYMHGRNTISYHINKTLHACTDLPQAILTEHELDK